jgi:hypothetical protein
VLDDEIAAAVEAGQLATANPRNAGRAISTISTMCTSLPQWFPVDGPSTPEQIATEYAEFALDLLRYCGESSNQVPAQWFLCPRNPH